MFGCRSIHGPSVLLPPPVGYEYAPAPWKAACLAQQPRELARNPHPRSAFTFREDVAGGTCRCSSSCTTQASRGSRHRHHAGSGDFGAICVTPRAPGALACETWLVVDAANPRWWAYVRLPEYHFDEELAVNEVSRLDHEAALATLRWLKQPGRNARPASGRTPQLASPLHPHMRAKSAARWAPHDLEPMPGRCTYPDFAALLRAIGPVLERRLAKSPCSTGSAALLSSVSTGDVFGCDWSLPRDS